MADNENVGTAAPDASPPPDAVTERIIEAFMLKMQAFEYLAESQIAHARQNQMESAMSFLEEIKRLNPLLEDENPMKRAQVSNRIIDLARQVTARHSVVHEQVLAQSIFMSLFGALDAFISQLLRNLYTRPPSLLRHFSERAVRFDDVVNKTKEEITAHIVNRHIESLLPQSYSTIFDKIGKRFGISLKKFDNWKVFAERCQRRNLITHCDGIVSRQYLSECAAEDFTLPADVSLGTKLDVSKVYLFESIDLLFEVGFKLGQTLWRVGFPQSIRAADNHLANSIFEILKREKFGLALILSRFAEDLCTVKNQHLREERTLRIIQINHAQAAKWSGDKQKAMQIINGTDWSGSLPEFRLAVAVLKEDYDNASRLMIQIGKVGELTKIDGYLNWPIYREFRSTPQFSSAFQSIYGVSFEDEVQKTADESAKLEQDPNLQNLGENHAD